MCRGSRSSTSWTARGPISTPCSKRSRTGCTPDPVALQIPVGQGPSHTAKPFRGVIDLVQMQMLTFPEGKDGNKIVRSEIPAELADDAQHWRERLLEALYDYSNELMELALAEEEIPEPLMHKVIRQATVHLQIQPVLCGSALHGMGVQPILDAVAAYLPSPLDVPPVEGFDVKTKGKHKGPAAADGEQAKKIQRKPDPASRFAGWCSRCLPYKTGDLAWVRIYSGTLEAELARAEPRQGQEGKRRPAVADPRSKKEEQLSEARAGDIVGVIGLRDSITGDTLCDTREPILLRIDRVPRDGDLDGDRAGEHRRSQEARRDARSCCASRTRRSGPRRTKRPARR